MKNIGFLGSAGAGKDTAALLLQAELESHEIFLDFYAFADPVKRFCVHTFGMPEDPDRIEKEKKMEILLEKGAFEFRAKESIRHFLNIFYYSIGLACPSQVVVDNHYYIFRQIFKKFEKRNLFSRFSKNIKFHISPREAYQYVGTEFFRNNVNPDIWTIIAPRDDTIFTDCRFPNEAHHIRKNDGIIVKIINYKLESLRETHVSESHIDTIKSDYVIHNSGDSMEQLHEEIKNLVKEIKHEFQ